MVLKKVKLSDYFYSKEKFDADQKEIEDVKSTISTILIDFLANKPVHLTIYPQIKPEFITPEYLQRIKELQERKEIKKEDVEWKNKKESKLKLPRTNSSSIKAAVVKLIRRRKLENIEYNWHVGISSNQILMFDLDGLKDENQAIEFGSDLKSKIYKKYGIENKVIIIKTTKGYHFVSDAELTEQQWMDENKALLESIDNGTTNMPFDRSHVFLNVQYNSTTLRISPKHGENEVYKVVKVI